MKVIISQDETFPIYQINADSKSPFDVTIEMTADEIKDFRDIEHKYIAWQDKLDERVNLIRGDHRERI